MRANHPSIAGVAAAVGGDLSGRRFDEIFAALPVLQRLKVGPHRAVMSELDRAGVGVRARMACPCLKVGAHGPIRLVASCEALVDAVENREARCRTVRFGVGRGLGDNCADRGRQRGQRIVEGSDRRPFRGAISNALAVRGLDRGLKLVGADPSVARGRGEQRFGDLDQAGVPRGGVLARQGT